jgi:hypothetical protein
VKHYVSIIPFEEHAKVGFYSIIIDSNINTELEDFLISIQEGSENDASRIVALLDTIGKNGAQERYFRYEGKLSDNLCALPDHYLIKTDYRLYALRYNESLLIFGNGGVKTTHTYQEDPYLNKCVTILQKVGGEIKKRIYSGDIVISGKTISGELDFIIYT